jgi:phospholipid/cholesterol/gamma-HCH transport system substrate-binding protein
MDERVVQFRIGVMILASVIIAAILVVMFGEGPQLFKRKYIVKIRADEAAGVTGKTPVRRRGILIGRVREVEFDEASRGVIISAEIDADQRIRENEVCMVISGLLGEAELDFIPPESEALSAKVLEPDTLISGVVRHGPGEVIGNLEGRLAEAASGVAATSEDLRVVIRQVGQLLKDNEGRINNIVAKTEGSMDVIQEAVGNVNDLVSDPELREQLKEALSEAPQMIRQTRETLARMNNTIDLVDRNLKHIEGFTRPLGERGEPLISEIEQAATKLDRLMGEVLVFSEALNSSDGSLSQLINNPDLYQNLNRAAANIEDLTRQLKPIMHDARVFTDKIARHPELLGVRGAIQKNAGTKGVPRFNTQNTPALWTEPRWGQ